jgi:hypothetical protein
MGHVNCDHCAWFQTGSDQTALNRNLLLHSAREHPPDESPNKPRITFTPKAGVYRHYKGGRYVMIAIAETHEHNGNRDVVYISLTRGTTVTRPFYRDSRDQDSWLDDVEWPDGWMRSRFSPESPELAAIFEGHDPVRRPR